MRADFVALATAVNAVNTAAFLSMALGDVTLRPKPQSRQSRSLPPALHPHHPVHGVDAAVAAGTEATLCPVLCEVQPIVVSSLMATTGQPGCGDLLRLRLKLSAVPTLQLHDPAANWYVQDVVIVAVDSSLD